MKISRATTDDISGIVSFIDKEWKENHILVRDEKLFQYEYQYNNNKINFLIARENNHIIGILGFIPYSINRKYYIEENSDYCLSVWKVSKNLKSPTTGIHLLQSIREMKGLRTLFCVGINKKTIGIYKYFGFFTGTLEQYVMLNENIQEFKIAKVSSLKVLNKITSDSEALYSIKPIENESYLSSFQFENYENNIPYKNKDYFIKRYFRHPIYQYDIYGAYLMGLLVSLVVTRVQPYNESKVLRIVDFIGDEKGIQCFGKLLSELIKKEGYEYADFYCFGLDKKVLNNAGFHLVDSLSEDLIIPNYFSPFLQKNIPIHFFSDTNKNQSLKLFKADGDQDRPN